MKKYSKIFLSLAIVFTLIFVSWATARIVKSVQFSFECKVYLKRAANANTVELAKTELEKAIKYVEENNLTEGVVSIFLKNPANDLGFWYQNMKAAYEELDTLSENASSLEKTNVLMKLRESLTDNDGSGATSVITPEGITVYPNNMLYFVWVMASTIAASTFWILWGISVEIKLETTRMQSKIRMKKSN